LDRIDETFIKALFTADYYHGYRALESYVLNVLLRIFHRLKISSYLVREFRTVDEVLSHFGFHSQSRALLDWALNYLHLMGHAERNGTGFRLTNVESGDSAEAKAEEALRHIPSAGVFLDLVSGVEEELDSFMRGDKTGKDILFSSGAMMKLWNDYFNNHFYGCAVINRTAAYGVSKWFSLTDGQRILEIGSGTSGGTVALFRMLRDNNLLKDIEGIVLSDAYPPMLDLGRNNIKTQISDPPSYEQRVLDVCRSPAAQGFEEESFDIIYGVNVLHVAEDLLTSMEHLRRLLRKGGLLIVGETIRPEKNRPMHHEIVSNLLDNYFDVKCEGETRPAHGFLTMDEWMMNFKRAGFSDLDRLTEIDFDFRPLHSVAVYKGRKT
jgi:SAM-dependent methyltransferase